jgi:hypothetical protein
MALSGVFVSTLEFPIPELGLRARLKSSAVHISGVKAAGVIAVMTAGLMLPALWNGYPIFYFDSVDYVVTTYRWTIPVYRTAPYGFFAGIGHVAGTVWAVAAVQSAIVAYILYNARTVLGAALSTAQAAIAFALLIVFTALPWHTSQIMPDAFTGAAILLVLMLVIGGPGLGRARRSVMIVLLGIASSMHPTHLAVLGGLAICCWAMNGLSRCGLPFLRLTVWPVIAAMVLGVAISLAANWATTKRVFIAPATAPLLTMAVLFQKGLAQQYLRENCGPDNPRRSVLCRFRGQHPYDANQFLWHNDKFYRMGGWPVMIDEAPHVLKEIVRRYPLEVGLVIVELIAEQLVTIKTGEGFRLMFGFIDSEIKKHFPGEFESFAAARQQQVTDATTDVLEPLASIHTAAGLAGLLGAAAGLWLAWRRRDALAVTAVSLVLLAYGGNAILCGAVSNPADRYGSRIIWVVGLCALFALVRARAGEAGRETPSYAR